MSRIFISYRRDETRPWAIMVNERLAARFGADKIFIDVGGIQPRDDWGNVIKNKVEACEVLIAGGETRFELNDDGAGVNDWKFSRDGTVLAVAYTNERVRLWRLGDGEAIALIELPAEPDSVALSPNGAWLGAACEARVVRVWPLSLHAASA